MNIQTVLSLSLLCGVPSLALAAPAEPQLAEAHQIFCNEQRGTVVAVSDMEAVTAYHVTATGGCTLNDRHLSRGASSRADDFSVVRYGASHPALPVTPISCEPLVAGENYRLDGYRFRATGRHFTTATEDGYRFRHMAQLEGTVPIGVSGGPVLNDRGELVAIVSSATDRYTFVKEMADTSFCAGR